MHSPSLVTILLLIKGHTEYSTRQKIADRLGVKLPRLTNWLNTHVDAPHIPNEEIYRFQDFFEEILPDPISKERTKELLKGSALMFHLALVPLSGISWANLIAQSHNEPPLIVRKIKHIDGERGIGTSSLVLNQIADTELKLGERFCLEAEVPFRGEAIVMVESNNSWYVIPVTPDNVISKVNERKFVFPGTHNDQEQYLTEKDAPGFYRYFVITKSGVFAQNFRDQFGAANPLPQTQLSLIADMMQNLDEPWKVFGASLLITEKERS